ncbi:hypothetical protein [Streptomyces sp. LBL]|uniref:hypothetical protein n=1 Tax=Streptomyces sp. LBL TaxID=2940562 RepID=UPI002473E803|nr:hypothetical protein [Streptomyces sp. LBL]
MADSQSNAPLRADAGAPTSGVIHVRTRLTAEFTVISNALAQRPGSAVTIGVAVYILSLPDGTPITIAALCKHFDEGEILISRALTELEEAGYLERRRERRPTGQIRTRTFFYDIPYGNPEPERDPDPDPDPDPEPEQEQDGPPEPPKPPRPRQSPTPEQATPTPTATNDSTPASLPTQEQPQKPASLSDADPQAVAVLTTLRRVDPRLLLSEQEAVRLAPAVTQWLTAGVTPSQITALLTARLPDHFLTRPAGILAFRLRETPLPAPPPLPDPQHTKQPTVQPFQTCDGCERAFRAPTPGHCRDCRSEAPRNRLRAAC